MRTALALLVLTAALALSTAPANAAPSKYCSPTGDFCHGWTKRGGPVRLYLDTFSFSGRISICVTTPADKTTCRSFRLRDKPAGIMGVDVRWRAHFPRAGSGIYPAVFKYGGDPIGEPVDLLISGP